MALDAGNQSTCSVAFANLADLAGKVSVTVRADSAEGFDKGKLQNGVLEPLRESDLIK